MEYVSNHSGVSRHYVMPDHSGSPVAVFDRSGGLVKRVDYTVYGHITADSAPDLNVYLAFQVRMYSSAHYTKGFIAS